MQIHKKEIVFFRVLLFFSVAMLALAVFLPTRKKDEAPAAPGGFVLLLEEVDEALEPHLHVGDRVLDRQSRRILGDILQIDATASEKEVFSETRGALTRATVPGKYDLRLTLSGTQSNGSVLTTGGDTVRLGQIYYFRTYDFSGEGRVVALL